MNSPPDLKQGHIIEARDDLPLHLLNCFCTPCHPKSKLRGSPVLLYEIELAVVLGVEVTKVTALFDELLQVGFLIQEVGLCKEKPPAAAISPTRRATKVCTLCKQTRTLCRPQTVLADDHLHPLEPARHGGMLIQKIKRLGLASREFAIAHAWPIQVVRPALF